MWYAWVWYCYVTELHAYDVVIKYFVIKRDIICAGCCIFLFVGFAIENSYIFTSP